MVDFVRFLTTQKPLCLGLPFYSELIRLNLYYKLAERSEMDFKGRNLFEQGCPNARICDDECLGRPVPMYPELASVIAKYNPSRGVWNGHDVWILKVDTCKTCPFKTECKQVCPSMNAFDGRNKNRDDYFLELASPIEELDDEWLEKLYQSEDSEVWHNAMQLTGTDIAWDCLTEPQKTAILLVEVQGKSFEQASTIAGVYKNAVFEAHASGMARLKEYGLARRALKSDSSCKYAIEYYKGMYTQPEIATMYGVSQKTVSVNLSKFKLKHHIST